MNKVYFVVEEVLKSSGKKKYKVLRLEERPSGKIKKIRLGTLDNENDAREGSIRIARRDIRRKIDRLQKAEVVSS